MTREEFILKWRDELAGIALRGLVLQHASDKAPIGELTAGAYALTLPERIDRLLTRMYYDAKTHVPNNGQPSRKP